MIEVGGSVNIDLDRNCRGCYTPRISLSLSLLMLFESRGQCSINASRGLSKASFFGCFNECGTSILGSHNDFSMPSFSFLDYFAGEKIENLCDGGENFLLLMGFVVVIKNFFFLVT